MGRGKARGRRAGPARVSRPSRAPDRSQKRRRPPKARRAQKADGSRKAGHSKKIERQKIGRSTKSAGSRRVVAAPVRLPRPTAAELRLLTLAQEVAGLARDARGPHALDAAVQKLAAAFGPPASLPGEVFQAWVRSRSDKTATLALAWAREQVRLGLQDVVERTPKGPRPRIDVDAATLSWLLLAACEAIAQEPPSAVADRVRSILELIGHVPATG